MSGRDTSQTAALLRWYLEAGVDETIAETPQNRYADTSASQTHEEPIAVSPPRQSEPRQSQARSAQPRQSQAAGPAASPRSSASTTGAVMGAVTEAVALASAATSLDALRDALAGFDGCALSKTATNLVFGDGNPEGRVVLIGEGPGAEEDRRGLPFVGPSGQLLDRMLASIGLDRTKVFISNTVFWRPPGNRAPTSSEIATCMPFVERILELIDPALLIALGGPAAMSLLGQKESVGKLRGRWFSYQTPRMPAPIPATALFHPAYLLRSPGQKRLAWRDLLNIKHKLESL